MRLYQKFLDGVPEYLARYYWWAYLWSWGIWLFDHQPIINAILYGQYDKLLNKTLALAESGKDKRILQLTCVYGKLTPSLVSVCKGSVHLCDAAQGQLQLARNKTKHVAERCPLARMNVECLGYASDTFDQVIVFFLLHEMPADARRRTYAEIARVVRVGGSVLITEYAETPLHHLLYRSLPFRGLLHFLEPFLDGFWSEDLLASMESALGEEGKSLCGQPHIEYVFSGFYRVMRLNITHKKGYVAINC
jgi:ubiquinone/menaquinone biosynthesis C-methylase UbiE